MLRLALPTGDLRRPLASLLEQCDVRVPGYGEGSRQYRLRAELPVDVAVRVFRERDIPVQIALGHYDVGVCGRAWVEEFTCRRPASDVVLLGDFELGAANVYVAVAREPLPAPRSLRIVSEYPNLAETLALALRLPAFRVLPVWGSAAAYPPEDADLALVAAPDEATVRASGLEPLALLLEGRASLIANRHSLGSRDLTVLLSRLLRATRPVGADVVRWPTRLEGVPRPGDGPARRDVLRLAVPDGHQQPDAIATLRDAGIALDGYEPGAPVSRPRCDIDGLEVKVIRPQDMPQQVALGHFDLAITGRDWLWEHKLRFPASPATQLVDLGRCRYTLVATVSEEVPGETLAEAVAHWREEGLRTVRVASEYLSIADWYAQEHHLGRYRVIPISGASEGFVPEDAEILIEGTETGTTIAANRLKIVERIFESTSCLIGREEPPAGRRRELWRELVARFQATTRVAAGSS